MIFRAEDRCKFCANYLGGQTCKAFPDGIPPDIWSGVTFHGHAVEGDHGIRYESRRLHFPDAEAFLSGDY